MISNVLRSRLPLWVVLLLLFLSAVLAVILTRSGLARSWPAEGLTVLGEEEPVELSTIGGGESIEVLAKVDTGAGYSSIDEDLAKDLGIDVKDPEDTVKIESANGQKRRPLVRVRLRVAGEILDTRVTVADRSELSKDMLLGSRDLEGFLVRSNKERLTSPDGSGLAVRVPDDAPEEKLDLAQIRLAHLGVFAQLLGGGGVDDLAGLKHVAAGGDL